MWKDRHGKFEPGKVQYYNPKFFDQLFLINRFETQDQGNDQTLPAFPAVAALCGMPNVYVNC